MDVLERLLRESGVPILASVLKAGADLAPIPGPLRDIGKRAIDIAADALKVEHTPEAVAEAIQANPEQAKPALQAAEAAHSHELAMAQQAAQQVLLMMEKSEGWLSYGWRRLLGWSIPVLGLWQLLIGPVAQAYAGVSFVAPFDAFMAYVAITGTYLMGGHTLLRWQEARR